MYPQLFSFNWIGALATTIILFSSPLHAEIYQWTDANGNIHFSDKVPNQQRDSASSVQVSATAPSEEDVREANERAARIQSAAQVTAEGNRDRARTPKNNTPMGGIRVQATSQTTAPAKPPGTYQEAMERYKQSQACYGMYKNENGSNQAAASRNCTNVPRPRQSDY